MVVPDMVGSPVAGVLSAALALPFTLNAKMFPLLDVVVKPVAVLSLKYRRLPILQPVALSESSSVALVRFSVTLEPTPSSTTTKYVVSFVSVTLEAVKVLSPVASVLGFVRVCRELSGKVWVPSTFEDQMDTTKLVLSYPLVMVSISSSMLVRV